MSNSTTPRVLKTNKAVLIMAKSSVIMRKSGKTDFGLSKVLILAFTVETGDFKTEIMVGTRSLEVFLSKSAVSLEKLGGGGVAVLAFWIGLVELVELLLVLAVVLIFALSLVAEVLAVLVMVGVEV